MFRFIIAVDINGSNFPEAYKRLHEMMTSVQLLDPHLEGWESTDEVYDNSGEPMDPEDVIKGRRDFFKKEYNND